MGAGQLCNFEAPVHDSDIRLVTGLVVCRGEEGDEDGKQRSFRTPTRTCVGGGTVRVGDEGSGNLDRAKRSACPGTKLSGDWVSDGIDLSGREAVGGVLRTGAVVLGSSDLRSR